MREDKSIVYVFTASPTAYMYHPLATYLWIAVKHVHTKSHSAPFPTNSQHEVMVMRSLAEPFRPQLDKPGSAAFLRLGAPAHVADFGDNH